MGELTAYRGWRIAETPEGLRLQSITASTIWEPLAVMHGNTKSVKEHCGIYGYKKLKTLKEKHKFDATLQVFGTVELWGDVIEHELGYRSEYAKITSLIDVNRGIKDYQGRSLPWKKVKIEELRETYHLSA